MSRARLKSLGPSPVADAAVVIVETTAVELPGDGLTPLWAALPRQPDVTDDAAVVPFATTLRRVG